MLFYKVLLLSLIPVLIAAAQSCTDDSDFTFPLDSQGGEANCKWLTKNSSASDTRIETYCSRGHVKGACQKSCKFCPCESNPKFSFKLVSASTPTVQKCNWISKTNYLDRQKKYCFEKDGVSASKIGTKCVADCGFCTGGSGTPAPSKPPVRSPPTSSTKTPTGSSTKLPTVTRPTSNTTPTAAPVTRSRSPTRTPTTKSPSKAPVTACTDDANFKFNPDLGDERKDCAWLTKTNANKRRELYCGRGHIKGACQKTCNFCRCKDKTTFMFPLQSADGKQNCEWLGKKNSASRQSKYCFRKDGESATQVGNKCVASCGFCSD